MKSKRMSRPPIPALLFRLSTYFAVQGVIVAIYAEAVIRAGSAALNTSDVRQLLKENAIIEWTQAGVLALICVAGLGAFRRGEPAIHRVLVLLAAFAIARELDSVLEDFLFHRAHHIFMAGAFLAIVAIAWRGREGMVAELPGFLSRPGFFFMFFGGILVVLYAQILGQRDLWRLLAPLDVSTAKRFVEEGLELLGYVNIAIGCIEERFFSGKAGGAKPSLPDTGEP
jgi:hypothetical protein